MGPNGRFSKNLPPVHKMSDRLEARNMYLTIRSSRSGKLSSEKESTCILPFVHPNVHVITCSGYMWLERHASIEEFTCFF
jgi:hypothetical protein